METGPWPYLLSPVNQCQHRLCFFETQRDYRYINNHSLGGSVCYVFSKQGMRHVLIQRRRSNKPIALQRHAALHLPALPNFYPVIGIRPAARVHLQAVAVLLTGRAFAAPGDVTYVATCAVALQDLKVRDSLCTYACMHACMCVCTYVRT